MKVLDLIQSYPNMSDWEREICEYCYHLLEEQEDQDGIYLICPNEMCLDNSQYYIVPLN